MTITSFHQLLTEVRRCTLCADHLPFAPRPIVQLHPAARILIVGQAPGNKAHQSGIPFNDASGDRLRAWMGVDRDCFYDEKKIAMLPMGFCFPGTNQSGDLPPRPECAPTWRHACLAALPQIQLTLIIGQYAQAWHLRAHPKASLTEHVKAWRTHWPQALPLPHPSPRNLRWFKQNPWFDEEILPTLRARIQFILSREFAT